MLIQVGYDIAFRFPRPTAMVVLLYVHPPRCSTLITEKNLDRFDTMCLTWRHPCLSRERLSQLLFHCYRQFFSLGHALRNVKKEMSLRGRGMLRRSAANLAMSPFSRDCAWRRTHPMSGGLKRVRLDGVLIISRCAGKYLALNEGRCR